jgi:hypothetical protein
LCQDSKPFLALAIATPVELTAIAGREQQRRPAGLALAFQQCEGVGAAEGKPLALFDGGCMVADANDMERRDLGHAQR